MPDDEVKSEIEGIKKSVCEIEKEITLISYKTSSLTAGVKWFGGVVGALLIANIAMAIYSPKLSLQQFETLERAIRSGDTNSVKP